MKKLKYITIVILFILLKSCIYGVNERTSHISTINNTCLSANAWDSILQKFSVNKIDDTIYSLELKNFSSQPFNVSLIYFDEEPREIVGVEYSFIRYLFNPKLSSHIIDGLSPELKDEEKKRVRNRIQKILMEYQCEEGKKESEEKMKSNNFPM